MQGQGELEHWESVKGKSYLLAIGIDDYHHCGKLINAVSDAKAFVNLMVEKYQFEPERVITLFNEEATKEGIASAFRALPDRVRKDVDNLVVYFSGHGYHDSFLNEGYWVPIDAKFSAEVDYVSYSYLTKVIKALPTKHTFFIVDSCYSGSMMVQGRNMNSDRFEKDPSRWMLASGRNEVVPDGEIGGSSPFAEQLLDTLGRNADCGLRVSELVNKVTTAVSYNSPQTPIGRPIYGVGDKGGEFVFHPKGMRTSNTHTPTVISSPNINSLSVGAQLDGKKLSVQEHKKKRKIRLLAMAMGLTGILLIGSLLMWKFGPSGRIAVKDSIAIIPFNNVNLELGSDYFVDGIHAGLIDHISRIGNLNVISRTTMMRYTTNEESAKQIADSLNVANVLEGNVGLANDMIHINLQLTSTKFDHVIWSDSFSRPLSATNIFELQSEIAKEIADVLNIKITSDQKKAIELIPTDDLQAYTLYLRATPTAELQNTEPLIQSAEFLKQSIQQDSNFAQAYLQLAEVYLQLVHHSWEDRDSLYNQAAHYLEKGIAKNPNLAIAYRLQGIIQVEKYKDQEKAIKLFDEAILINPNDANTYVWKALAIADPQLVDDPRQALEISKKALTLNPMSLIARAYHADFLEMAGDYQKSITLFRELYKTEPDFPPPWNKLSQMSLKLGLVDKAAIYAYSSTVEQPAQANDINYMKLLRNLDMKQELNEELKIWNTKKHFTNSDYQDSLESNNLDLFKIEYLIWPDTPSSATDTLKYLIDSTSLKLLNSASIVKHFPVTVFQYYYYTKQFVRAKNFYDQNFTILNDITDIANVGLEKMSCFLMYLYCLEHSRTDRSQLLINSKSLFTTKLDNYVKGFLDNDPEEIKKEAGLIKIQYNRLKIGLNASSAQKSIKVMEDGLVAEDLFDYLNADGDDAVKFKYVTNLRLIEIDPMFDRTRFVEKKKYKKLGEVKRYRITKQEPVRDFLELQKNARKSYNAMNSNN